MIGVVIRVAAASDRGFTSVRCDWTKIGQPREWKLLRRQMGESNMKKTVCAAIALLVLTGGGVAWGTTGRSLERIQGGDRFATAVEISKVAFPDGALEVYLARADNPVDALPGAALARRGPILFVPQCGTVPQFVIDEVNRLNPLKVTALGGEGAICAPVLDQFAGPPGTEPPSDAITVHGGGTENSDPFRLSGGSYRVTYDYSGDCFYNASLDDTGGDPGKFEILPGSDTAESGDDNLYNIEPGEYFVDMSTGANSSGGACPWTITFESR